MSTRRRRLTVELTEAQYLALVGAVCTERLRLEDQDGSASRLATLDRAWGAVHGAWGRSTPSTFRRRARLALYARAAAHDVSELRLLARSLPEGDAAVCLDAAATLEGLACEVAALWDDRANER